MTKARLNAVSWLLLTLLILVSASTAHGQTNAITITFWNGFTASDGEVLREIVNRYNATNTENIQIRMDIMPWDVMLQRLPPAIATNTGPDLILIGPESVPQYVANGALLPLDEIWEATSLEKSDFAPSVLEMFYYNGRLYQLPMQYNLLYLYWNKEHYRSAGLNPDSPPETWTELGEYAVRLTNVRQSLFGFGMPVSTAPQWWTSVIWGNGGEFFDLETKTALLNTRTNLDSLEFLRQLAVEHQVSPRGATGPQLDNLMIGGRLGMYVNGPWLINGLKGNGVDFGIDGPPRGTVRRQVILGGVGFAVTASASPQAKQAAMKFIEYWNSPEVGKEWTLRNGFPPYLLEVIADPEIRTDPIQAAIAPLADIGRTWTLGYESGPLLDNDALWPMFEAVLTGAREPAEALRQAHETIQRILDGSL